MNNKIKNFQNKLLNTKYILYEFVMYKQIRKYNKSILFFLLSIISILYIGNFTFNKYENSLSVMNTNIAVLSSIPTNIHKGTVVIDPGHGGIDEGTSADKGVLKEKDIVLKIAFYIKDYLNYKGYKVVLTRDSDKSLTGTLNEKKDLLMRSSIANNSNGNVFMSLHVNYCPEVSVKGITLYHYPTKNDEAGKYLSNLIMKEIKKDGIWVVHDLRSEDFSVLRNTNMPAVLIECGFISNYGDKMKLYNDNYLKKLAHNIGNGIIKYLDS